MSCRTIEILTAIKNGQPFNAGVISRSEAILKSIANKTAYTETPQSKYEKILLAIKNGATVEDIPQTRLEEILTAIANETLEEYVINGNLLTYPYDNTTKTIRGITFTDNKNGTITATGTATDYASFMLSENVNFGNDKTYLIAAGVVVQFMNDGQLNWAKDGFLKWRPNYTFVNAYIQVDKGETVANKIYKPFIFAVLSDLEEAYIAAAIKLKGL